MFDEIIEWFVTYLTANLKAIANLLIHGLVIIKKYENTVTGTFMQTPKIQWNHIIPKCLQKYDNSDRTC